MALTAAQLQILKTSILANSATIQAGQPNAGAFVGMAISAIPNSGDGNLCVASWYNLIASPTFWVWQTAVSRAAIYTTVSDLASPTVWSWTIYKGQSAVEQGAWTQMFMGDSCNFGNLNNRAGVNAIFGASNTQRDHCFAVSRRLAKNIEKVFASAVVSVGGITVNSSVGNTLTDALGATTNPAVMGFEGNISGNDVNTALNLP